MSLVIALFGMRGVGLVGQKATEEDLNSGEQKQDGDVEMAPRLPSNHPTSSLQEPDALAETRSLDTLTGDSLTGDTVLAIPKVGAEPNLEVVSVREGT